MNQHTVPNATLGYLGKPKNGGSNPRFYDFDDGVTRLVKWHPSAHGEKAAYNELVASRLGQLIGAPILRGAVVYVPDEIIPADHRATGAQAGFHFGVKRMEGENFVPVQHYKEIENRSELPHAAVHLAWLAVGDHEGHNQFFQRLEIHQEGQPPKTTKYFRLIDMGQMFGNGNWNAGTVARVHDKYVLPPHLAEKLTMASLKPAMEQLGQVEDAAIRACFEESPQEWHIPDDDIQAATRRALAARDRIEKIIRDGNKSIE